MIEFTPTELAAFREELFKGFTDTQFDLAITECQRRSLIPGSHVVFQLRASKEWVPELKAKIDVKKIVKITTIEALRLIAQRTGEYEGQGDGEFIYLDADNRPTIVSDIPLPHESHSNVPKEPWAARIPIFRKGFRQPTRVVARMDAYAVTRKTQDGGIVLTDMWLRRGPEMLLKCSTAAALRASFAEELGGLYLAEEFDKEDAETKPESATPTPVVDPPKPAHVPEVNHTPAVPTDAPRPNEVPVPATIEDVVLPKKGGKRATQVQKALDTYMENNGMPVKTFQATDDDLPRGVFEDDPPTPPAEPVQKMDTTWTKDTLQEKIRSYDPLVYGMTRDQLKAYSLKTTEKTETSKITHAEWSGVFEKLDSAFASGGKQAVVDLVKG